MAENADPRQNKTIDSPAAWFAVMEAARTRGDFTRMDRAERELHRLGVEVRFRQPPTKEPDHAQ